MFCYFAITSYASTKTLGEVLRSFFLFALPPMRAPRPWVRYSAAFSCLLYLAWRHRGPGRGTPWLFLACFTSYAGTEALGEVLRSFILVTLPPTQALRPWARYSSIVNWIVRLEIKRNQVKIQKKDFYRVKTKNGRCLTRRLVGPGLSTSPKT